MTFQAVPESAEWVQLVYNLLALDQSSNVSGWAIFEDGNLKKWGHFTTTATDIGGKLQQIRDFVIELINTYNIDEAVYEDIQLQNNVGNNVQTFKVLAEVYGVLTEVFERYQIPAKSYISTHWKSVLNIKGRTRVEQKRNAQAYVLNTYGKKCTQDEADAICIGASVNKLNSKEPFDWS